MRVAMLLSGCGSGGGSQIEEFILTYLALDTYGLDYIAAAPEKVHFDVIDHLAEEAQQGAERNVLAPRHQMSRYEEQPEV